MPSATNENHLCENNVLLLIAAPPSRGPFGGICRACQAGAAGAERQGGLAGGGLGGVEEELRNEQEIARLQQLDHSLRAGTKL